MCNAYLEYVHDDITHVWHMDDDEFYPVGTLERVLSVADECDAISFTRRNFTGDFFHQFEDTICRVNRFYPGARYFSHRPTRILNPDTGQPWTISGSYLGGVPFIHHYTLVLPHQRESKAQYYTGKWGSTWVPQDAEAVEYSGPHPWWIEANMKRILREYGSG